MNVNTSEQTTMTPRRCFVQFLHPGPEHRPDRDGFKDWNRKSHRRKFMCVDGRAVRGSESFQGELLCWGEWEAQSEVEKIPAPVPSGPRYIHRPFYSVPDSYVGLQNTDPFIFEGFYYTGCQQHTKRRPTQLRFLMQGSVILFGSCVQDRFALDTVFVVDHWVDHTRRTVGKLEGLVPRGYQDVTLAAWYQPPATASACVEDPKLSFRLYFGATYDNRVDGMFSFFPCRPSKESQEGFVRPTIGIDGIITNNQKQKYKLSKHLNSTMVAELWREVVPQVEAQGLWLGVWAGMPEQRVREPASEPASDDYRFRTCVPGVAPGAARTVIQP